MDGSAPTRAKRSQAEYRLTVAVADLLRVAAKPGIFWSHFPAGEKRTAITGARLKRMGLRPGCGDFLLLMPAGGAEGKTRAIFLELKTETGRVSDTQRDTRLAWELAGGAYFVCRGYQEAFDALDMLGALRVVTGKHRPREEASVSSGGAA